MALSADGTSHSTKFDEFTDVLFSDSLISSRLYSMLVLKFSIAVRLEGHKQRKLNDMFIPFFCLCPLGVTIELNSNVSKVTYWI